MGNRLYERNAELAALDNAVSALGHGHGSAVLIEARAGRGKSTLVEYAVAAATELGARVLVARARHLESAAPFEVLRRLLGPAVEEAGGAETLTGAARFAAPLFTPGADIAQGVDYGSQWLIAQLAEQAPLVLAVDDAHWADAASLRVLLEVQAEISVQPVVLLLASRPVENPDAQRRLATMAAEPDCVVLSPALLSREGVRAVVLEVLGEPVQDAFVDSCVQASGGNAFYLRELLRPYRSDSRPDRERFVKDGGMSLRRTMAWRLGELGRSATELAQAAAVLGDGCSLHVAGELAALDDMVAVAESARLEAASVFAHGDPVDFVHPLIRAAVERTLTTVGVGELHGRAARLLRAHDASPGEIVQHLVQSPGSGDTEVAMFLAQRGRVAMDSGSVAVAAQLLRRALDEPPPVDIRDRLLVALAEAEHAQGHLDAARECLDVALASNNREVSLHASAELFDVLESAGRYEEMADLHRRVVVMSPFGTSDSELRLQAQLIGDVMMGIDPELDALPGPLADVDTRALELNTALDRHLMVTAAIYERTMQQGTTQRLEDNLRRVVASLPSDPDAMGYFDVRAGLIAATFLADDDLGESDAILEQLKPAVVRMRGAAVDLQAEFDHRRTMNTMRRGDFDDALAMLAAAEDFTARNGLTGYAGHHAFVRGWIALERGNYSMAARYLDARNVDDNVLPAVGALLAGSTDRAIAVLEAAGLALEVDAPVRQIEVELEPHLIASHVYQAAGDRERARAEASRELAIRRTYGPRFRLAEALRRVASFLPTREAIPVLEEAVALAETTSRRPVLMRVLASYGASLRRVGADERAREVLYRAVDGATEMGMDRVRAHALGELALAGGRPRRARRTGPDSLTNTQRQVALLAAEGLTNREIAEQLYVTIKTVETHLAATYRKLGIKSRDELSGALAVTLADGERPRLAGAPLTAPPRG